MEHGTLCSQFVQKFTDVYRADSLKDDRTLLRRSKPLFDKRDFGPTNEQQRHFNELPISDLHGEVG
jgi:hypothetical protein